MRVVALVLLRSMSALLVVVIAPLMLLSVLLVQLRGWVLEGELKSNKRGKHNK